MAGSERGFVGHVLSRVRRELWRPFVAGGGFRCAENLADGGAADPVSLSDFGDAHAVLARAKRSGQQ